MNKQQLASKIWSGANDLRGKVSASNYKDYMLGFIFYKYLSNKEEKYLREKLYFTDKELEKLAENDLDTVKNCQENIGFFIAYKNLFSTWLKKGNDFQIKDVRVALSAFDRNIGPNYKKVYNGIFDTLEKGLDSLGNVDGERTKAVRKLNKLINEIPTDANQNYDVLGFVYEFLLKNFAANAGKAGEFYTPYEASLLMSEIITNHLKDKEQISIYDPTSGSGSLLINIGKMATKNLKDSNKVKYYAQELIDNTYNLTRMNLIMRDILPDNIVVRNGDTLADDWPFFDDNDKEKTYDPVFVDAAISNPPYSQTWNTDNADSDIRFSEYGVAPKSKADYAFLLHNLYHIKPDGIMTIVLPHGVLFRGGEEAKIREKLVEKNNIEAIIGLPSNMFFGTGIPTIIMVLKKNRENGDILFVDASKGFVKEGNKNKLRSRDVKKIVDAVLNRETHDKFSRLVSKQEIIENEYNLNIPRYIDSTEPHDNWDIYSSMFGGVPNYEIEELSEYWNSFRTLKDELFMQQDIPYSILKTDDIDSVVKSNLDVEKFISDYDESFDEFGNFLRKELIEQYDTVSIYNEEQKLADYIKDKIRKFPLIDYYAAYQILDDDWNQISLDLEMIQAEGLSAIKTVDPNMVYKKNKDKEIVEVQNGWLGKILPFELIQKKYFEEESKKLNESIERLTILEAKKQQLLDSIDSADKAELLKDDSEDIDSKKLNFVISKIKKQLKSGAEFEEDSYETIIININSTNEEMTKTKKIIKASKEFLEIESKKKIEELSDEEAIKLLEDKWIYPLINRINNLPLEILDDLIIKIKQLKGKYEYTYKDITDYISENKNDLISQLEKLNGSEFDMKGIEEFKKLIGGRF